MTDSFSGGRRRVIALVLIVLAVTVAAPASASAVRMTYLDRSGYGGEVKAAVGMWNDSGAKVRLVATRSKRADIIIGRKKLPGAVVGLWAPPRLWLEPSPRQIGHPRQREITHVIVHELGHALGLRHRSGCTAMVAVNTEVAYMVHCKDTPKGRFQCGPQRVDVRAAARRYGWAPGGRAKLRARDFGTCLLADSFTGNPPFVELCPTELQILPEGAEPGAPPLTFKRTQAFVDPVPYTNQASCTWEHGETSAQIVIDGFPPNDGAPSGDKPDPDVFPSGNCSGRRVNSENFAYSRTRYLTARTIWREYVGGAPVGGWQPLLESMVAQAEAAQVGAACAATGGR